MLGAPEVGQAQLQLLPCPVAGDVVGGGPALVLRRDGGEVGTGSPGTGTGSGNRRGQNRASGHSEKRGRPGTG